MLNNHHLYFKDQVINTLSEFEELLNKHTSTKNIDEFENSISHQNGYYPERRYQTADMYNAQILFETLIFLENVKYMANIVNARAALSRCLYSEFDPNEYLLSPKQYNVIRYNILSLDSQLQFGGNTLYYINEIGQPSKPTSIRKYFENYLKSNFTIYPTAKDMLLTSVQKNAFSNGIHKDNTRFYIPINYIPEFLLEFIYNDGRDFSGKRARSPHSKSCNRASEFSYRLVLKQLEQYTPKNSSYTPEFLSHLYRIDNNFYIRKLHALIYYYELYTSDKFLDQMIKQHSLSYKDAMILKETTIKQIFYDKVFMQQGLRSPHTDFMLAFDIRFQCFLFSQMRTAVKPSLEGLIQLICECKNHATQAWKTYSPTIDLYKILKHTEKNELDILTTEKEIIAILKQNTFFQKYYLTPNTFISYYLEDVNGVEKKMEIPFSFNTIKDILPHTKTLCP